MSGLPESTLVVNPTETMARLYNIFSLLRAGRPTTYLDDFALVFRTLMEDGPKAANAVVENFMLDEYLPYAGENAAEFMARTESQS